MIRIWYGVKLRTGGAKAQLQMSGINMHLLNSSRQFKVV